MAELAGLQQVGEVLDRYRRPLLRMGLAGDVVVVRKPTALPPDAPWPLQHPALAAVAWCVALLAILVPLTVRGYRARTAG